MTLPIPKSTPICPDCGITYGKPARTEFPQKCGVCAICDAPGWTSQAREYGLLPDLPVALRKKVFKKSLHERFQA